MKRITFTLLTFALIALTYSCEKEQAAPNAGTEVPQEVINKIAQMGFNPDGIEAVEEGYRIERDIIITHELLESTPEMHVVPNEEQYRTSNFVITGGSRTITVYIPEASSGGGGKGKKGGGSGGFSNTYVEALNKVVTRYNFLVLDLSFERATSSSGADIVFTRLGKGDERRGVLGSAGFPSGGDPYGEIKMSGILESFYGLSVDGIATIMAHEVGHCIGFRHTDYFDRSISCGGSAYNEGPAGVGAVHIPDTPTGADLQGNGSWMLSCTDGSNRDFTFGDEIALNWMYKDNF